MGAGSEVPGVRLDRGAWKVMRDATLVASPREACGYLGGTFDATVSDGGAFAVGRAGALANESEYDQRYHFLVPADRVRRVAAQLEADAFRLLGFYHSHPSGGLDPSQEDVERAWPGQLHLITSFAPPGVVRVRAFEVDAVNGEPRRLSVTLDDERSSSLRGFWVESPQVETCPA